MKFKVGDVCLVNEGKKSNCTNYNELAIKKGADSIKITKIDDCCYDYNILARGKLVGSCGSCLGDKDLKKITKGTKKPIKVNFLLQYELEEDPIEEFETEEEVRVRIKELSERSDLQEDSLVVYDVSRVRKITLKRELVIGGL